MIGAAWSMGVIIGFVSVFTGIYTTEFAIDTLMDNPKRCEFEVIIGKVFQVIILLIKFQPNHVYSIVTGVVSFWIPAIVMVYVYIR